MPEKHTKKRMQKEVIPIRNSSKSDSKNALKDPMDYGKAFLNVDELSECIGLSRAEIYKFLKHNELPIAKNGRRYLIPAQVAKDIQTGDYYRYFNYVSFHNLKTP